MTWDEFVEAAGEINWVTYLATAGPDGRPHVAPVSIGFTERTIWFGSLASSRKIRNIRVNPHVAFHWPVTTGSGPGELFARATARLHDSKESRLRLWEEIDLAYDLALFFQSAENPDLVFVEAAVTYASLLRADFTRDSWRSS
ncbi:MAG: pyridoxamine 5'-phosphate oxidase family protein [Acidimicrobiia bacterium]|nr:pyridoxamine 5'-phosphate oxidase family protein [Acidimicrobiia bacterium]